MLPFRPSRIFRNNNKSERFAQFFTPAGSEINFKKTFFISLGLFFATGGFYVATHLQQNVTKYQLAYQKIPDLIANRKWKHTITSSSSNNNKNKNSNISDAEDEINKKLAITKSNESITIIDASNAENATARLVLPPSSRQEGTNHNNNSVKLENLGILSKADWPELLQIERGNDKNEVFITIGVRRAFGQSSPIHKMGFTHAVVLVEVRKNNDKQFSIFGYNAGKLSGKNPLFMLNDMNNVGVTKHFTFYNELTIQGTRERARRVFERMEQVSDKPYKIFTCNCFSPIFTAMLEEANLQEMKIPQHFMESMSICVPTEQNFGFGMSSNSDIKPYLELASAAVNVATKRKLVDVGIKEK